VSESNCGGASGLISSSEPEPSSDHAFLTGTKAKILCDRLCFKHCRQRKKRIVFEKILNKQGHVQPLNLKQKKCVGKLVKYTVVTDVYSN
jgi:hypothetical protein